MKFKKLYALYEDIESMKQYYPNIPDENFQALIELDPTYKKGSKNAGTYGKWILGLANKNKGVIEETGHITDILTRFEEVKNKLVDKNITKFKTVQDLEDYLNDENSYKELSDRQKLRQTQKNVRNTDLSEDAEKIYEDSDWEVWIPKTYEASCKLGRGTEWCTASTEQRYYYDNYTNQGPLYININKHSGEKYQFHFESEQFMDKADKEIDIFGFFIDNPNLSNFYSKISSEAKYINDVSELIDIKQLKKDGTVIYNDKHVAYYYMLRRYIKKVISNVDIGPSAFNGCDKIDEIILNDGVEYIHSFAFASCGSIVKLTISSTLRYIADDAFLYSNVDNIYVPSLEVWNNIKFDNNYSNPANKYADIIVDNKRLREVTIHKGDNIHFANTNIERVTIEEGVEEIPDYAFDSCQELREISLPKSLKKIGREAFSSCILLDNIDIPNSVSLDEATRLFAKSGIQEIRIPQGTKTIPSQCFGHCLNLESVYITSGVTKINEQAFSGCAYLTSVFIPKTVEYIGPRAFYGISSDAVIYCEREYKDAKQYGELRDIFRRTYMTSQGLDNYTPPFTVIFGAKDQTV